MTTQLTPSDALIAAMKQAFETAGRAQSVDAALQLFRPFVDELLNALSEGERANRERERELLDENIELRRDLELIRELSALMAGGIDRSDRSVLERMIEQLPVRRPPDGSPHQSVAIAGVPSHGPPDSTESYSPEGSRDPMIYTGLMPAGVVPSPRDETFEVALASAFQDESLRELGRNGYYKYYTMAPLPGGKRLDYAEVDRVRDFVNAYRQQKKP